MKKLLLIIVSILVFLFTLNFVMINYDGLVELIGILLIIINFLFIALAIMVGVEKGQAKTHWTIAGVGFLLAFWGYQLI